MSKQPSFEWDPRKNTENTKKHYVSFEKAQHAFLDPKRVIAIDHKHSTKSEKRYFCYGLINEQVITVRFTLREDKIRIFGAGYWRAGRSKYYEKNEVH